MHKHLPIISLITIRKSSLKPLINLTLSDVITTAIIIRTTAGEFSDIKLIINKEWDRKQFDN
jgi:hypothetical protein